jgi:hypothetical protein
LENNINRNFNGEPFQQCPNDNFMVHYTGAITVPQNQTISFMVAADDGGTVKIGDTAEFGAWNLKGCQWSTATSFALPAGTYTLDGWFFEATGDACYMLAWNINGAGFQIVPDDAFSTEPTATTTTAPTTTTARPPLQHLQQPFLKKLPQVRQQLNQPQPQQVPPRPQKFKHRHKPQLRVQLRRQQLQPAPQQSHQRQPQQHPRSRCLSRK